MSSQIYRVVSGETIAVRTGVIQGIGPQGPTGPTGPAGPQGPRGYTGAQGPTGYVDDDCTICTGASQALAGQTATLVAFGTVIVDDLSAQASTTNFVPGEGNFYLSAYVKFANTDGTPVGIRRVEILQAGTIVAADSRPMMTNTTETHITVATGVRISSPGTDIIQVRAYSSDPDAIVLETARIWISPHGPGPQGSVGPTGPIGPVGPTGLTGPIGPPGDEDQYGTTFQDLYNGGA